MVSFLLKDVLGNFHPFCVLKLLEVIWGTGDVRLLIRTSSMVCGASCRRKRGGPLFKH